MEHIIYSQIYFKELLGNTIRGIVLPLIVLARLFSRLCECEKKLCHFVQCCYNMQLGYDMIADDSYSIYFR